MAEERICFVISPIGAAGSEVRKRADQVLKHIIEPAVNKCGYETVRSDKIAEPGNITSQVISHVLNDPMVIADISGSNGNVFYELALRHASKKPFVQIINHDEKIPFDIANMRTVQFDYRDLDSAQEARDEIERQVKAIENKSPAEIETPITVAVDFQALRQSDNPEQRSLAEVFTLLNALRGDMNNIERQLSMQTVSMARQFEDGLARHLSTEGTMGRNLKEIEELRHELSRQAFILGARKGRQE